MNARTSQCYNHRDRSAPVRCCATCQRIGVEVDIVTRTVDALLAAGYALATEHGDGLLPAVPTRNRAAMLGELMEVDDEYIMAYTPGRDGHFGWVRFVYGNGGYDVISDYSVNLETTLEPVNAYADSLT
jgi:hypothetical protein